jgi:hypothetical protein
LRILLDGLGVPYSSTSCPIRVSTAADPAPTRRAPRSHASTLRPAHVPWLVALEGHEVYGELKRGTMIRVTWSVPAEISGEGREVLSSDQGVFEGIENGAVFIRRSNGTLKNYLMSSIWDIEVIS